jgi:hypothetical protein
MTPMKKIEPKTPTRIIQRTPLPGSPREESQDKSIATKYDNPTKDTGHLIPNIGIDPNFPLAAE